MPSSDSVRKDRNYIHSEYSTQLQATERSATVRMNHRELTSSYFAAKSDLEYVQATIGMNEASVQVAGLVLDPLELEASSALGFTVSPVVSSPTS
jgi:hypothetical protein